MTASLSLSDPEHRFTLTRAGSGDADFGADVRTGLTASPKSLPPRWFYDALGSSLFDTICFLPEYYVLRAESEVLTSFAREIVGSFGMDIRLIELGSGTARKTRILLDNLTARQQAVEYVPIDIDAGTLERCGRELLAEYPRLHVRAVAADFTKPSVPLATLTPSRARNVVLFLGSTIGNLDPQAAVAMLRDLRGALVTGDALLLGTDLRKSATILEPAYDDALGVTAAFNLNLLGRINRELGGTFALDAFRHRAFYDEREGRIEMHLVSRRAQTVRIEALALEVSFDEGESIHTESSYKHDARTIAALAEESGFVVERTWNDEQGWFADVLMVAR